MSTMASPGTDSRIESLDILRGLALFGVLVVNLVREFRVPIFEQFVSIPPVSGADYWVDVAIGLVIEMKAFAVFSFVFGVSLAIQHERFTRDGRPVALLLRRQLFLLTLGLAHLLLVWNGDILVEYALAGLLVIPFLFLPTRATLVGLGLCILLRIYVSHAVQWPDTSALIDNVREARQVHKHGSYGEYLRFSFGEIPLLARLHLWVFPRTLALLLLGILAWRSRVLLELREHRRALVNFATLGLVAGLVGQDEHFVRPLLSQVLAPIGGASLVGPATEMLLAAGYVAAVLYLVEFPSLRRYVRWAAPIGRMTLSNYLLQSFVLGWLFHGYGLALSGRVGVAGAAGIAVLLYVTQVAISCWWLRRYPSGPMEWVGRALIYGRRSAA
jgi:uncharacterized protein